MLIALTSLAFFLALGVAAAAVAAMLLDDGHKISAALAGRSVASQPVVAVSHVTVRFSPRYPVRSNSQVRAQAELRVAA